MIGKLTRELRETAFSNNKALKVEEVEKQNKMKK
jgi:hypothetical protein